MKNRISGAASQSEDFLNEDPVLFTTKEPFNDFIAGETVEKACSLAENPVCLALCF